MYLYVSNSLKGTILRFPLQRLEDIKLSTKNGQSVSLKYLQTECEGTKIPGTKEIYYRCKNNTSYIINGLFLENN
jgi:hypothetical protein